MLTHKLLELQRKKMLIILPTNEQQTGNNKKNFNEFKMQNLLGIHTNSTRV